MYTLIFAEKPSQAQDIAKVIGIKRKGAGHIVLINGDIISWAVGHLLELCEPQVYDESWGGYWRWPQLPMIPATWKYQVNKRTSDQFKVVKALLKDASKVIIATDAGREGELIARSVLEQCKYKGLIERFWTSSLVASDIRKALDNLKKGSETYPLYEAALARSHSDWMWGLTGTRAVTLALAIRGDYFPVGRVKTPTLAMVVRRKRAIDAFGAQAYFELEATVTTAKGVAFKMTHAPSGDAHILSRVDADALKTKAQGYQGPLSVKKTQEAEAPPLPYSLPVLQKEANRILGFTAKNTLKVAQELYELKAATYPRTDCRHLAQSQVAEVPAVLEAMSQRFPTAVAAVLKQGIVTRKSTFDDSKLVDHHGIVPTMVHVELTGPALQLFTLICQQYLRTISPDNRYLSTKVSLDANGVLFKTTGKTIVDPGWRGVRLTGSADDAEE
jgi:DNA topoisomerase-3